MKNLKKLFASVASIAILASLVPVATLGAASYSDELQGAYDYAYNVGITTQSSIDAANMYGTLTRAHMAKMMVNFAKEVFNQEPDTSKDCSFTDLAGQTQEMKDYIEESCQLGLMGVGITAFNPNGAVTRAQFGTVLSRVLRGDENEGGTPYYANHLAALKDAGIMNNISNPMANEIRGYVMLMMERADDTNNTTPAVCETPENQTACSLGLDTCPAECTDNTDNTEVTAGNLEVSLNSDSLKNGTEIPANGTVRFAVVDFSASSSDDVSLKTIELKKIGLATIPTSTRVWFEKDGVRVSGKSAFTSEWTAVISFAPAYEIKAWDTESFDLYVSLATDAGQDFQFASNDISSTAENVDGDFTTAKLRTANYTVAPVDVTMAGGDASYNASTDAVELWAFRLSNDDTSPETRDVEFKSITLRQDGNGDLSNLSDIVLVRNWVTVSKNPVSNGKDLTFSIGDTIKDGTAATYYIKAIVDGVDNNDWDTYKFTIRNTSDVNAIEAVSAFRSTITLNDLTAAYSLHTYTVKGSDITFSKDSSVELSANYAAGSEDVILMKGTIAAKSAITLEDPTVAFTVSNAKKLSEMFSTIYLKIGTATFSYTPNTTDNEADFLGTATVNGSVAVKMYGKLKDTAPIATVKFSELKLDSFTRAEYVSNSNTVKSYVGSIAGVNVTAQSSTLNVTKNDALWNQYIAAGTNGLLAYGLKLTSDQGNGATISNAVFTITSDHQSDLNNNGYLTLYVNGTAVASKTINGTTVTFDNFNAKVTKTSPVTLEVKADLSDAYAEGTLQLTLNDLNAVDTLTSKEITTFAKPAGAVFTVATAIGNITTSDNNPKAQLFLSPSTAQKLVAFKLTAKNDDVRLYDVNLSGTSLGGLSNFVLVNAAGTVIATANSANTDTVMFTQIANAPKILKDKSETYYVVADVNSNTNVSNVTLELKSANIKSTNGSVIAAVEVNAIASNTHATDENTLVIAKAANPNKLLSTSALRFTVTANGKDSVLLNEVDLSNQLAGYTTGTAKIVIYKNSVSAANKAGETAAGTFNGTVTLNANNTVDAGNTVTYIVAIEWSVLNASSNTQDWSMSMTNVNFGSNVDASSFDNVAAFPITETK